MSIGKQSKKSFKLMTDSEYENIKQREKSINSFEYMNHWIKVSQLYTCI